MNLVELKQKQLDTINDLVKQYRDVEEIYIMQVFPAYVIVQLFINGNRPERLEVRVETDGETGQIRSRRL